MKLKDILDGGMQYLADNNLPDFYAYLESLVYDDMIEGGDIGRITMVLEECDIDTINNLKEVPFSYCKYGLSFPSSIDPNGNGEIRFPSHIKKIGEEAFTDTGCIVQVDLTGIEEIGNYAFNGSEVDNIVLPADAQTKIKFHDYVFDNSQLSTVHVMHGPDLDMEEFKRWFTGEIYTGFNDLTFVEVY